MGKEAEFTFADLAKAQEQAGGPPPVVYPNSHAPLPAPGWQGITWTTTQSSGVKETSTSIDPLTSTLLLGALVFVLVGYLARQFLAIARLKKTNL
jgi:hypothetical protein